MNKCKKMREQGSALLLAIFLVFVGLMLMVSVLTMTAFQSKSSLWDRNWTTARYYAESVAKEKIDNIETDIVENGYVITQVMVNKWNCTNQAKQIFNVGSGNLTSVVTVSPNLSNATSVTANLISKYTIDGVAYTIRPDLTVTIKWVSQPSVTQLFGSGVSYYNDSWDKTKDSYGQDQYSPPSDKRDHIAFFGFNTQGTNELHLNYTGTCKGTLGSGSGWAILYGLTGTANNPDGYFFQYDPGAGDAGSFFVKREKSHSGGAPGTGGNEWLAGGVGNTEPDGDPVPAGGEYYPNDSSWWPIPFEPNSANVTGPSDSSNLTRVNLAIVDNNGVAHWDKLSLELMMDNYYYQQHLAANDIPAGAHVTDVQSFVNYYKNSANGHKDWVFDIDGRHTIRIDVVNDRHYIYCDGKLILSFVDNTSDKKSMKDTCTGVRSWNADTKLQTNPANPFQDNLPKVTWKK